MNFNRSSPLISLPLLPNNTFGRTNELNGGALISIVYIYYIINQPSIDHIYRPNSRAYQLSNTMTGFDQSHEYFKAYNNKRPKGMTAWKIEKWTSWHKNHIVKSTGEGYYLPAGDVYCRMPNQDGTLCKNKLRFAVPGSLRKHLSTKHEAEYRLMCPSIIGRPNSYRTAKKQDSFSEQVELVNLENGVNMQKARKCSEEIEHGRKNSKKIAKFWKKSKLQKPLRKTACNDNAAATISTAASTPNLKDLDEWKGFDGQEMEDDREGVSDFKKGDPLRDGAKERKVARNDKTAASTFTDPSQREWNKMARSRRHKYTPSIKDRQSVVVKRNETPMKVHKKRGSGLK